jgi:hypothetical protein
MVANVRARAARWFVFKPKLQILGKFWRVLQWKVLVYFMDTWSILRSFVIFYGHLVHLARGNLVYFFPVLVFCTKKSGNPGSRRKRTKKSMNINMFKQNLGDQIVGFLADWVIVS